MRFDPKEQMLICDYCTSKISVSEYEKKAARNIKTAKEETISGQEAGYYQSPEMPPEEEPYERIFKEAAPEKEAGEKTFKAFVCTCPSCGGQLLAYEETAATFCSFCGASVLLESRVSEEKRPDEIIAFKITKEQAEDEYRKLLKKSLFAPREMKKEEEIERFRGIYMPYWVYSYHKEGPVKLAGSRSHRAGDYIVTDHFLLESQVKADFNGVSYDASSSFSDSLSEAIAPFDFSKAEEFDPAYISGFYADTSDVEKEVYSGDALSAAKQYTADMLLGTKELQSYNVSQREIERSVNLNEEEPRLAFFPVWFLAGRNKKDDRVSYAVVNGQTGKAAADLPVDKKKLILGTLLIAIPIFIIFNLVWTLTPSQLIAFTFVFAIVSLIIANRQLNLVYTFENRINDKGYMSKAGTQKLWNVKKKKSISFKGFINIILIIAAVFITAALASIDSDLASIFLVVVIVFFVLLSNKRKKKDPGNVKTKEEVAKAPFSEKIKILIKPLIAIVLGILVLMADPVADIYYYAACIICMLLVAWSFWDILGLHNRLAQRPLPQFKKRGGENYEKY